MTCFFQSYQTLILVLLITGLCRGSHLLVKRQSFDQNELRILPEGPQHKPVGKNFLLTCKANVKNPELVRDLKWFGPGGQKVPEDDRIYTEEKPGDAAIMLFIKHLREEESGLYTCEGIYANNEKMTAQVQISTYIGITWDDAPEEQNAVIYTDYKIRCVVRASPTATIDWLKESLIISTGNRYVIETDGLLIKDITQEDAGTYTCRAKVLERGSLEERDIKLEVHVPPAWIEQPSDVKGIEQGKADFYCNSAGTPNPVYTWVDWEGRPALSKEGWTLEKDTGHLIAHHLKREDEGEYTCIAENPAGRIEAKAMLDVVIKPKIQELYNKTLSVGTNRGSIICKASGDPLPEIIWRKWSQNEPYIPGGQPLDDRIYVENSLERAPDYTEGETEWRVSEIVISDIKRKDDGLYECQARNEGGEFFKSGHIQVEFAPTFEETPVSKEYSWDQHPINLTCIATAIPNATITWFYREREIGKEIIDRNYQIIGEGPRSDLKVTPLEAEYYGRYTCEAKNQYGQAQHEIELQEAREPSRIQQAVADKTTATTIQFRFVSPSDTGGLPIEAYAAEYKEATKEWNDADRRVWPASENGVYILENLYPRTTYDFRFGAKNLVGYSEWSAGQQYTMPQRGPPEAPKIDIRRHNVTNNVLTISSPTRYEISWMLPEDNGEPVDYFEISFYPVAYNTETMSWSERGNLFRTEVPHPGNVRFELKGLYPDTYHMVEIRAHNHLGFSPSSTIIIKTAQGEGSSVVPWQAQKASVPVGIILGVILIVLLIGCIIADVICCKVNQAGVTYLISERALRASKAKKRNSQYVYERVPREKPPREKRPHIEPNRTIGPSESHSSSIPNTLYTSDGYLQPATLTRDVKKKPTPPKPIRSSKLEKTKSRKITSEEMRPTAKNNVQETYPTKLAKTHYKSDSNLADPREKNPRSSDDQTPWPPVDQYAYQNHPWSKGNPALAAHSRGFHSEWVLLQPHENLEPRNSLMEDLDPCIWRDKAAERDRIQSRQSLPEPIYSSISDEDDPSTDQGSRQIKRKRFEPPNSPLAKSHHGHTDNAHAMLKGSTQAYHSMFNVGNEDAESDEAAEERMRQFMLQKANSSTTSSSTTTVGSVSRKKPAWITRIQNRKKDSSSSSDEAANRRSQRRPRQMIANLEVQPRGDPQGLKTRKPTNMVANGSNSLQTKNSSHLLSSQQENSQKYDRDRHRCSDRIPEPMKSKPGTAFLVQNTGNTSSFSNSSHAGNDPVLYLSSPSLSIRSNAKGYSSPFQRGEQLELRSIRKPNRDPSQQMTITNPRK
ncbi:fasciclin-2-like isoform X2 [Tigriopus californicus]|uniref:fasciclin-2-like isoform X2 n=1 Tax=Tigriopus californicus TaxID=6832 RepID=UPI0027D9E00D|nr:fasciclin-2-like isoform X2 [Tigriopus californicus]